MTKVLCGGVFNLLHPGHLLFLEKARALGDELVVVIARREHISAGKQAKLIFSAEERARLVGALKVVDRAIAGGTGSIYDIVETEKPDVIALGYDQGFKDMEAELEKRGLGNIEVVRLSDKFEPEKHKSSKIIERIQKNGS